MTFEEMEAADKEKVLEQAKEALEKQSRADRAAASKAAKEAEKAAKRNSAVGDDAPSDVEKSIAITTCACTSVRV